MAHCPSCAADNPEGFRFCGTCGTALTAAACASCGFANPPGQRFCGRCGEALVAATSRRSEAETAERRLATVLFADVVGFTTFAEDQDPESVARVVDSELRRMTDIVVRHGGTIDKYMGDALMALFGVPVAHDDDAARAVAAAVAMRDAGGELRFSIGINSGDVIATRVGQADDVTVIGDAVNIAARLEKAAAPGEILVGPLTAELVSAKFVLEAREPAMLKGKRRPVPAYAVIAPRVASLDDGMAPPLVGREPELDYLRWCWHRAVSGSRAQVVLITGDAGVGKTRLADEMCTRVEDEGLVVRSVCPGYGALVGTRLAVELNRQLSVESSPDADPAPPAAALDDAGVLRLRRLIAERAEEKPLLIVIDDCHNAATSDLDPLVQLSARIAELPLVFLLLGRPQPATWLAKFAGATAIHLNPLARDEATRLATLLAGEAPLAQEAAAGLAAQAAGNPLHLRELIRLLLARGILADGVEAFDDRPPLPPTLQAVLAARLDALAQADKAALQDVAIFSDGATPMEIAAVSGTDVEASLDRLVTAGLLVQREGRHLVGDPLLREVAYEQLSHATRGERHRRAAAVASTSLGQARHLGLAATYLPQDKQLCADAATALAASGLELLARSHFRDGIQLMQRAVDLGFDDPAGLLRLAEAQVDIGLGGSALDTLQRTDTHGDAELDATVLHVRGNAIRDSDAEESAAMLAEAATRWATLGNQQKQAWAVANRGMSLFELGRLEEAATEHETALQIFTRLGDQAGVAASGQALALERPDDPRVPAWLDAGLELAEESGDLAQQRNSLISLAWTRFVRSNLGGAEATAQALHHAEQLAAVSAELGDAYFEMQARCIAAVIHRLAGRNDAASEQLRSAQRAASTGHRLQDPLLHAVEFMVRTARGDDVAAPPPVNALNPLAMLADSLVIEALLLAGDVEAAIEHLTGSTLDVAPGVSLFIARLLGVARGAVLVLSGRYDEAEASLTAARDAANAVAAHPTEATAIALLAEAALCRNQPGRAGELLASVTDDPGGIAGLLLDRVRWLAGDADAESRLRAAAQRFAAPGLTSHPQVKVAG